MQVLPAAQTVPPVQPAPAHCPYFGTTAPVGAVTVELVVDTLLEVVEVLDLLVVLVVVALLVVEVVTAFVEVVEVDVGFATDVVGGGGGGEPPAADCPLHTAGPGTV